MTKKEEKLIRDIEQTIVDLKSNFAQNNSSGAVGSMQQSHNQGVLTGLEIAKKVILKNVTK